MLKTSLRHHKVQINEKICKNLCYFEDLPLMNKIKFAICFDIMVGNRIENDINPSFYVKMKSIDAITRQS